MTREESLAALRRVCEPDLPLFLLVDPMVGDVFPQTNLPQGGDVKALKQYRETVWGRPVHMVELERSIKLEMARRPYLVEIEGVDDPWLETSFELALDEREGSWAGGLGGTGQVVHKIGGWLRTKLPGESLAALLGRWMRLNTETYVSAKYLRLADPRVLSLLSAVLGAQTLQERMGRLRQWCYFDAHGSLQHLNSSDPQRTETAESLRLNREQWSKMALGHVVHGAIARAFGQTLADLPGAAPVGAVPYVAAITAAQGFSIYQKPTGNKTNHSLCRAIRDEEDLVAAVALHLLHPGWENRTEILKLLEEGGEETLAARCSDIHGLLNLSSRAWRVEANRQAGIQI